MAAQAQIQAKALHPTVLLKLSKLWFYLLKGHQAADHAALRFVQSVKMCKQEMC